MSSHDDALFVGDFKNKTSEIGMSNSCNIYHLYKLAKDQTSFQNKKKLLYIQLILINFKKSLIKIQSLDI